ncbi:BEND2 protein, partial [Columbina picui]|nr:BEND2 protein [Columbina picui]
MSMGQNSEVNSGVHHVAQVAYGSEGLSVLSERVASHMNHSASMQRGNGHNPEKMDFVFLHNKRKRLAPSIVGGNVMRTREGEYEDSDSIIYEYEPDYECRSTVSEASYTGDQQKTLLEVLSYCQAMYDAIQKLDKKFDLLHWKVSEMQHARVKPLLLKPVSSKDLKAKCGICVYTCFLFKRATYQICVKEITCFLLMEDFIDEESFLSSTPPVSSCTNNRSNILIPISNLSTVYNLSVLCMDMPFFMGPCLETICGICMCAKQTSLNILDLLMFNVLCVIISVSYFVGDPVRNVKVFGSYLMKARQKTKPKYAARYLVRVLFPKETLSCSIMGVCARGRRTLDPNKIAAIREFLATNFPTYDLSEHGKDWKTCITNVNAMIRCLRSETKKNPRTAEGKEKVANTPDTSHCVDLNYNEDSEGNSQNSQKMTSSTANTLQNSGSDKFPEAFRKPSVKKLQSSEPMELLGSPWRNVQLPFSVIYVAKGKSRPELSARYLIRHLFPEDVLVRSNVYGNLERGMNPLDCNRINALR